MKKVKLKVIIIFLLILLFLPMYINVYGATEVDLSNLEGKLRKIYSTFYATEEVRESYVKREVDAFIESYRKSLSVMESTQGIKLPDSKKEEMVKEVNFQINALISRIKNEKEQEKFDKDNEFGSGFNEGLLPGKSTNEAQLKEQTNKIVGTVLFVLQIASVGGIIFAGIRYMFASANQKADIKNSLIALVIGMVLVFGASTVANYVVQVTNEVLDTSTTKK